MLLFLSIACLVPWVGWSLVSFGFVSPSSPLAVPLYLTGWACSIGGFIATYREEGNRGVMKLLREATRTQVPIRFWMYVVLLPIVCEVVAALVYLGLTGTPLVVKPAAIRGFFSPALLGTFLFGPLGEEFGWRGYLLPRFVDRFSGVPACLGVGVIWGLWHWPLFAHNVAMPATWAQFLIGVPALSFLIGAVYLRTRSLFLTMVMHWSFNSAHDLVAGPLLSVPQGTLSSLFTLCSTGVLLLLAMTTIPWLRAVQRQPA